MGESPTLVVSTATAFVSSFVLTATALASPSWITEDFYGTSDFGLLHECRESLYNGQTRRQCGRPQTTPPSWAAAAALLMLGLIFLAGAVLYVVKALSRSHHLRYGQWLAFIAAIFFALASLIFPIGFSGEPVGGEPFKLSEHTSVGSAYILFIVALLMLLIGELLAMKIICMD